MADISEVSSIVSTGIAVAGFLGSGIVFLWGRVEFNNRKIQRELHKCHDREVKGRERRGILMTVIELLWQEVNHLLPQSGNSMVLDRAKKLLDGIKTEDEIAKAVQEATDRDAHNDKG